ncbi:MAG TPA: hypothetical protein VM869_19175 [Enhygromyxa sp.]|nr:hypothetical protein [Enhygromyxa sp.]
MRKQGRQRDYERAKRFMAKHGVPKPPPTRRVCEHPECGREVGVYNPKGGDGTLDYYYAHNKPDGEPCPLSNRAVPSDSVRWEDR